MQGSFEDSRKAIEAMRALGLAEAAEASKNKLDQVMDAMKKVVIKKRLLFSMSTQKINRQLYLSKSAPGLKGLVLNASTKMLHTSF